MKIAQDGTPIRSGGSGIFISGPDVRQHHILFASPVEPFRTPHVPWPNNSL